MMPNQDLKTAVMNRVWTVYIIRRILNMLGFKLGWLVILFAVLGWFVSVANIARNFIKSAEDVSSVYSFVTVAFINTGFVVQAVSLGIIAVGVFFVIDVYRTFVLLRSSPTA